MKLIDVLVEELPKRGGWPEGADYCVQHSHHLGFCWVIFNRGIPSRSEADIYGCWGLKWKFTSHYDFCAENLAIDHSTAIITREQYEAALAANKSCAHDWIPSEGRIACGYLCRKCGDYNGPESEVKTDADGWIEWGGGECPVHPYDVVDYKMQDGSESSRPEKAGDLRWDFCVKTEPYAIVAYRLHKPQEVTDDETDLNECIGQDVAPVWSGEGLPPVGCECEYQYKVHGSEWCPLECVAVDGKAVFGWSNNTPVALRSNTHNFRPLRSEVDKKREEAIMSLAKSGGAAPFKYGEKLSDGQLLGSMWCELYDAIAAGKVRGVKLED